MTSVVIAAHNEAAVIGRCLGTLLSGVDPDALEVTVVANGCTDTTAEIARGFPGVRVIELQSRSKPGALNAGDTASSRFPRIYLDADMTLSGPSALELAAATGEPGVLVAVPARVPDTAGRPLPIRAYFAINSRLPAYKAALFGRGVVVLAEEGRKRFEDFPEVIADDLFLDSKFAADERREVGTVRSIVETPRRTKDLIRQLTRVRAGNAMLRRKAPGVRPASRWSWLRDVVLPKPWLAPAAVIYVGIATWTELAARRHPVDGWGRDNSTR